MPTHPFTNCIIGVGPKHLRVLLDERCVWGASRAIIGGQRCSVITFIFAKSHKSDMFFSASETLSDRREFAAKCRVDMTGKKNYDFAYKNCKFSVLKAKSSLESL